MDPSQLQEDKSNDSHSLESGGGDDKDTGKSGDAVTTEARSEERRVGKECW